MGEVCEIIVPSYFSISKVVSKPKTFSVTFGVLTKAIRWSLSNRFVVITFVIENSVFGKVYTKPIICNEFFEIFLLVFKQVFKVSTISTLIFAETFQVFVKDFIEIIIFVSNIFQQNINFDKFLKSIIVRGQCFQIFRAF